MTTSAPRWRRPNYSPGEVRGLLEEYAGLKARADTHRAGLYNLVRLADLWRALELLPLKYWEVVLLHGLLGVSQEDTAAALRVSQQAVSKRYRLGLEEIHFNINGGDPG